MVEPWWVTRKDDLLSLAGAHGFVFVYDDETINDAIFDFLYVDEIQGLLYTPTHNAQPRILEKVIKLGAFLKFNTLAELSLIKKIYPYYTRGKCFVCLDSLDRTDALSDERESIAGIFVSAQDFSSLGPLDELAFVHVEIGQELAANKGRKGDPLIHALEEAANVLSEARHRITRVVLSYVGSHEAENGIECTLKMVGAAKGLYPAMRVVVLSGWLAMDRDDETGYPNMKRTGQRYKCLKGMYPDIEFWSDPEELLIQHAGGLVIKVEDCRDEGPTTIIGIPYCCKAFERQGKEKASGVAWNISTGNVHWYSVAETGLSRGTGRSCKISLIPRVSSGETIVLTKMGDLGNRLEDKTGLYQTHYLCARRMCAVKL